MHWYHFTGIEDFYRIVLDEALLAFYERMKRHFPNKINVIENLRTDDDEDLKRCNVFLTRDKDRLRAETRDRDVRLDFELDRDSNYHGILIVPELSLDLLVRVDVVSNHLDSAKLILHSMHNGKYEKIPVRSME